MLSRIKSLIWAILAAFVRRALIPLALAAFSAAIWFAGPMLAYGGYAPLEGFWTRVIIICLVWLTFAGVLAFRFYKRRKAQKALEASVADIQEETGDSEELSKRMDDALATLRKASNGRNFLYDLPWYVIIGPPGAGKTTALLNSGLKFPLAAGGGSAALSGVGGTRYCDWWFAEEAVMIDTAGRYTTQDSDAKADEKSWLHFLAQLNLLRNSKTKAMQKTLSENSVSAFTPLLWWPIKLKSFHVPIR